MALFHKSATRYVEVNGQRCTKATPDARKISQRFKLWTGRFRDADGIEREVTLFRDKEASRQKLAELVRQPEHGHSGLASPFEESAAKPLPEHVAEWLATLKARNRSAKHLTKLAGYVKRTAAACGWKRLKDLSSTDAEQYLAERRETVFEADGNETLGLSFAASNDHVAALKNLGNRLIKSRPKRWPENLFTGMSKLNSGEDVRLERRPAGTTGDRNDRRRSDRTANHHGQTGPGFGCTFGCTPHWKKGVATDDG